MEQFFLSEWPAWRYHATQEARIFKTAADLAEAGEGWVDSPALLGTPSPVVEPVADLVSESVVVDAVDVPPVVEAPAADDGLDDLSKADLQALCTTRGIEFDGRWSRATLVAKLRGEE